MGEEEFRSGRMGKGERERRCACITVGEWRWLF